MTLFMSRLLTILTRLKADTHFFDVLTKGSAAFLIKIFAAAAAFGFNVLLARTVGVEGTGLYFLTLSIITVVAVVGRLGQENAVLRYVSEERAKESWSGVKGVIENSFSWVFLSSLIVTAMLWIISPWLVDSVFDKPNLLGTLQVMACSIPFLCLLLIGAEALKGLKHTGIGVAVQSLMVPASGIFFLLIYNYFYKGLAAPFAYLSATIVVSIVMVLILKSVTREDFRGISAKFDKNIQSKIGYPFLAIALLNIVMTSSGTFIIGIFHTETEVAFFGIASRLATLTSFILIAVNSIAAPKFAELHAKNDMVALERLARRTCMLTIVFAAPLLGAFLIAPKFFLGFFGAEFQDASFSLQILAIGQFVNVATGSVGYLLIMCGQEKKMRTNILIATFVAIGANILLVPELGVEGAAIATSISLAFMNLVSAFIVFRYININIFPIRFR